MSVVHKRVLLERREDFEGVTTSYIAKCNDRLLDLELVHHWKSVTCKKYLGHKGTDNKVDCAMYRLKNDLAKVKL